MTRVRVRRAKLLRECAAASLYVNGRNTYHDLTVHYAASLLAFDCNNALRDAREKFGEVILRVPDRKVFERWVHHVAESFVEHPCLEIKRIESHLSTSALACERFRLSHKRRSMSATAQRFSHPQHVDG